MTERDVREVRPLSATGADVRLARNPAGGDLAYTALFEFEGKTYCPAEANVQEGGQLGGGYRVGLKKKIRFGNEDMDVREILTSSAGGAFGSTKLDPPFKTPENRAKRLELGYEMWKKDPMGGLIVSTTTNFTFSGGHKIQSAVENLINVIKKFDRKNDMKRRFKRISNESVAFGDVFLKLIPHREDVLREGSSKRTRFLWRTGQVQVVPIAAVNVTGIDHNPDNVEDINFYIVEYEFENENGQKVKKREKIKPIEKFNLTNDDAAMIHLKINDASNDVFGTSDLLRVSEWISKHAEYNRDSFVINKLYRSPMIDITIKDGDETDVRRALRNYQNFEIGSNPVHNDKEEWSILEFTGANVSQKEARRALLLMIATGVGFPEFFFADGSNSNLASSRTQIIPTTKKFEDRQDVWLGFMTKLYEFVLDVADELGRIDGLEPDEDFEGEPFWNFEVAFSPILLLDQKDVADSNNKSIADKYMSLPTAAARMGLDFETERELIQEFSNGQEQQVEVKKTEATTSETKKEEARIEEEINDETE